MKIFLLIIICALTFARVSERNGNNDVSLSSQTSNSSKPASPSLSQTESSFAYEKPFTAEEIRKNLDELKEIERESRKMIALRNDWDNGVAECMSIMKRLKPKAQAIQAEQKRMLLSPGGFETANAANWVTVCVNCVEDEDDADCRVARNAISDAEKQLKRDMRQK